MKRFITYIAVAFLAVAGLSSCETYGNYSKDMSPIYPLCGEWASTVTDQTAGTSFTTYVVTSDVAAKTTTDMWVVINTGDENGTKCKIQCDVKSLTFSGSGPNTLEGGTSTITDGKVVVDGATPPSGGKADYMEMTYTSSVTGHTYKITGFRRTFQPGDEL
ncbi:MAG: hypothetical protein LKM37_09100 [Bacteroidales bacterium]|nr:hypothetical protein [Bacteroidales bacterium]MCI1733505.1 hypothetical protein [Bacteroidales bacterium]